MTELLQNYQGPPPGDLSRPEISESLVSLAQRAEGVGLVVAVAEFGVQGGRLLVAGDRFRLLPQVTVGEAQAVVGGGLAELVTDGALHLDRLLAVAEGAAVIAQLSVEPADGVE